MKPLNPLAVAMVGALAVVAATVNAATITVQPQDRAAFAGQGVQLGIVAIGSSPVFQWHSTNGPIAAATGSVLSLSNLSIADAGRYWAVVSDADGAVTSRVARLTVLDFSQEPGLYVAVTGFVGVTEAPVLELFTLGVGPLNNTLPAVAGTNADFYFLLERTMNFTAWTPIQANLHYVPLAWRILPLPDAPTHAFHRVAAISAFAPRDSDGDRIDDIYELEHPEILNPLDPTDAARDPDMNGFTHQQEYRILRGLNLSPDHYISREVTSFNFGLPTARAEAMSREVSAFNGERPPPTSLSQMLSREVTAFNFGLPSSPTEAISREVSSFNFGVPVHPVEALSREVSVFNGEQPPPTSIAVAISREVTVFNFGLPIATVEAISREVSVFNDLQ